MSLITAAPDTTRRHALLIGTTVYQQGWQDIGEGVRTELARAKHLFLQDLGYQSDTLLELINPTSSSLTKELARWRTRVGTGPDDWLLVYYTGHGIERAGMLHLITTDIESEFPETAPTAQQLVISIVGSEHPCHVLLIIDTCQSGAAQLDVVSTAARLRDARGGAARGADFNIISSARSIDDALVSNFIESLSATLTGGTVASPDDEHVQFGPALERTNELLRKRGGQRAGYAGAGEGASRFLPSPAWMPRLKKNMEEEARSHVLHRIQSIALRSHWNPRSRGVATEHDAGWFFTGRSKVLRSIVEWLSAESVTRGLVITGRPGSGKSAVLARIVTLADSQQRALAAGVGILAVIPASEIPPEGALDATLHARAKDPSQLALELSAALRIALSSDTEDPEAAAIKALEGHPKRICVAIDALDEAQRPYDCAVFLRRLLQKVRNVRLLIGLRTIGSEHDPLIEALGERITLRDLDAPAWYEKDDVARYVYNYLLNSPGSSYGSAPVEMLSRLAGTVSDRAGSSFLVASVTAHALASRADRPDADAIQQTLPTTVGEALALDLARFPGIAGEQIRIVLLALAVTCGRGLPQAEWFAISKHLSGGDISEADLDHWSREAGFYIVQDQEFGDPVQRLYHEEFSRELYSEAALRDPATNPSSLLGTIASALLDLVPRDSETAATVWQLANSYTLAYYPQHLGPSRWKELIRLITSPEWIEAKRRRFASLEPVLIELDLAVRVSRQAQPPALADLLRACAIYTRFAMMAPPLVIDVLQALGQQGRAELMAGNIEFPLDRCQAFSLLAIRHTNLGNTAKASGFLRLAERAAQAVQGHFSSMALYWVAWAARESGLSDFAHRSVASIHRALNMLPPVGVDPSLVKSEDSSKTAVFLWANDRWEEDKAFALPHWLFWAAKCLRVSGDVEGLGRIRDALAATGPLGTNLVLQTAAVAGDLSFLRSVTPGGIVKPRNLALALVEAGLKEEFDTLRAAGSFDAFDFDDSAKRYAWALARCGDWSTALDVAETIENDLEERARAYYRISQVALESGDRGVLDNVAGRSAELLTQLQDDGSDRAVAALRVGYEDESEPVPRAKGRIPEHVVVPRWRVESWLAPVMLAAGRNEDARKLVESICALGIAPSRENSLAMATPRTAHMKGHVRFNSSVDVDQDVIKKILEVAAADGTSQAREELWKLGPTQRTKALSLAQLSSVEPNAAKAYALWLDALAESRSAGRQTTMDVIARAEALKDISSGPRPNDLCAIVAAVDEEFGNSFGVH